MATSAAAREHATPAQPSWPPGSRAPRFLSSLTVQCLALAAVFVGYHFLLLWWMAGTTLHLGALRARHLVPLVAIPRFRLTVWVVPALAVLATFLLVCRPLYLRSRVAARWLLPVSLAWFFVIGSTVAMIRGYVPTREGSLPGVLAPYLREEIQYYADVGKVERVGPREFLRTFSSRRRFDSMAIHSRTHPPGPLLFLWASGRFFGYTVVAAWLSTVLFGALATVPVYLLGRLRYGEAAGRCGLALYLLTPAVVLYTTTSMDGPFSVPMAICFWLFARATAPAPAAPARDAALAGLALAASMLMTYSAVFLVLLYAAMAATAWLGDRERFWRICRFAGPAGAAFLGIYAALFLWSRFDALHALRASIRSNNEFVGTGHETPVQYLQVSLANLAAFLIGAGLPLVLLWLRHLGATVRGARANRGPDLDALAFAATLLLTAFAGLYTLETERIWLFMAPLVVLPAARQLEELRGASGTDGPFYWTAGLLCLHLVLFEVTLSTMY